MRQRIVLVALLLLSGCGKADHGAPKSAVFALRAAPDAAIDNPADMATAETSVDAPPPAPKDLPPPPSSTAPAVTIPQIAYTYSLTFRLAADEIAGVQQADVALCDQMGIARCHVVSMTQNGAEHGVGSGNVTLVVDAKAARAFGDKLIAVSTKAGGDTIDRGIEAEDLSKQIVDTEAHLRAKQALADRLLEVLRTHQGGVADLVNAEHALSDVQEEIDTAASELAEARGRVQMSTYRIDYTAEAVFDSTAAGPLGHAWSQLGNTVGASLGALMLMIAALLPWLIVLVPLGYGLRHGVRRLRQWRRTRREMKAPTGQ